MTYTTTTINANFRIKVFGIVDGKKINQLFGCSGVARLIDGEMFDRLTCRAFRCKDDVCHCRLRRGLKVSFYAR